MDFASFIKTYHNLVPDKREVQVNTPEKKTIWNSRDRRRATEQFFNQHNNLQFND